MVNGGRRFPMFCERLKPAGERNAVCEERANGGLTLAAGLRTVRTCVGGTRGKEPGIGVVTGLLLRGRLKSGGRV